MLVILIVGAFSKSDSDGLKNYWYGRLKSAREYDEWFADQQRDDYDRKK